MDTIEIDPRRVEDFRKIADAIEVEVAGGRTYGQLSDIADEPEFARSVQACREVLKQLHPSYETFSQWFSDNFKNLRTMLSNAVRKAFGHQEVSANLVSNTVLSVLRALENIRRVTAVRLGAVHRFCLAFAEEAAMAASAPAD